MGIVGLALGLVIALLGAGPDEHVLVTGRLQLAASPHQSKDTESRRFELTIARRGGQVLSAQACVFADLARDGDWNGACFPLDIKRTEDALGKGRLEEAALSPVDSSAQRLLRLLADETIDALPARRVLGYAADNDLDLYVSRFTEADL